MNFNNMKMLFFLKIIKISFTNTYLNYKLINNFYGYIIQKHFIIQFKFKNKWLISDIF